MATGYIVENRGGQSFGEAQGLDTGQWEPLGSPVDGGGIFGAWALDCEGSGDGVDNSMSPGTMATATTMADNVRRLLPKEHRFGFISTTASGSCSSIPTVRSYSLTNRRQAKDLQEAKQDKVS